ncbi:hypothetical protein H0H93_006573, partial [Arthromyces matolae]
TASFAVNPAQVPLLGAQAFVPSSLQTNPRYHNVPHGIYTVPYSLSPSVTASLSHLTISREYLQQHNFDANASPLRLLDYSGVETVQSGPRYVYSQALPPASTGFGFDSQSRYLSYDRSNPSPQFTYPPPFYGPVCPPAPIERRNPQDTLTPSTPSSIQNNHVQSAFENNNVSRWPQITTPASQNFDAQSVEKERLLGPSNASPSDGEPQTPLVNRDADVHLPDAPPNLPSNPSLDDASVSNQDIGVQSANKDQLSGPSNASPSDGEPHTSSINHEEQENLPDPAPSPLSELSSEEDSTLPTPPNNTPNEGKNTRSSGRLLALAAAAASAPPEPLKDKGKTQTPARPGKRKGKKSSKNKNLKSPKKNEDDIEVDEEPEIYHIELVDLTLEDTDDELADDEQLNLSEPIIVHSGPPLQYVFTGSTDIYDYTPTFHLKRDVSWCQRMHEEHEPLSNDEPLIKIFTKNVWEDLSYEESADVLQKAACVVVLDRAYVKPGFRKETFNNICSLNESTYLHDQSISSADKLRKGTVNDMFASMESEFPRALNALYFPAFRDEFPVPAYASDYAAWIQSRGRAYCDSNVPYPLGDMRWYIASTGGTLHYWHTDANGYGTFIFVIAGVKLWFIAIPKDGNFDSFASAGLYTKDFDIHNPHSDRWTIKLIVLGPGDMLIMRPNLPHAVVTPEPSICKGGHESQDHLPDPTTWEGALCLFYLCAYFELYSALVSWPFADSLDPADPDKKTATRNFHASIKNRMRARSLLYWFFTRHEFECNSDRLTGAKAYEHIFGNFLARQSWSLIHYKRAAWKSHLSGENESLSPSQTREDIQLVLREGPAWRMFNQLGTQIYERQSPDISSITFAWNGPSYNIRFVPGVSFPFPYSDGHVYGDRFIADSLGIVLNINPRRAEDNDTANWKTYTVSSRKVEDQRKSYSDSADKELPTYAPGFKCSGMSTVKKPDAKRNAVDESSEKSRKEAGTHSAASGTKSPGDECVPLYCSKSLPFPQLVQEASIIEDALLYEQPIDWIPRSFPSLESNNEAALHPPTSSIDLASAVPSPVNRSHARRAKNRADKIASVGHVPSPRTRFTHHFEPSYHQSSLDSSSLPVNNGAYTARRDGFKKGDNKVWTVEELQSEGLSLFKWDGTKSCPLVDRDGRIIGVLVGRPHSQSYMDAADAVYELIVAEGLQAAFRPNEQEHRRGPFPAVHCGIVHAKGTTEPMNVNSRRHVDMINRLVADKNVQRLATFASASFQAWAPNLYQYYSLQLNALWNHMPNLRRIFPRSIFPSATFNFGPNVWTYRHRDVMNCPFGWCAVQALGRFDPTKGGHLILWDLELFIEFPPGCLILLPSACISHSNTPVQSGDVRASFTQYAGGGLFRYVDHGFQTAKKFQQDDPVGYQDACDANSSRWQRGLQLFSQIDNYL